MSKSRAHRTLEMANRVRESTDEVLSGAFTERGYTYTGPSHLEATPRSSESFTVRSRATTSSFSPSPTQSRTSKGAVTKSPLDWRSDTKQDLWIHDSDSVFGAQDLEVQEMDGKSRSQSRLLCGSYPLVRDLLQEVQSSVHSFFEVRFAGRSAGWDGS